MKEITSKVQKEETTHEKVSKAIAKLKSRWFSALNRSLNFRFIFLSKTLKKHTVQNTR